MRPPAQQLTNEINEGKLTVGLWFMNVEINKVVIIEKGGARDLKSLLL